MSLSQDADAAEYFWFLGQKHKNKIYCICSRLLQDKLGFYAEIQIIFLLFLKIL